MIPMLESSIVKAQIHVSLLSNPFSLCYCYGATTISIVLSGTMGLGSSRNWTWVLSVFGQLCCLSLIAPLCLLFVIIGATNYSVFSYPLTYYSVFNLLGGHKNYTKFWISGWKHFWWFFWVLYFMVEHYFYGLLWLFSLDFW